MQGISNNFQNVVTNQPNINANLKPRQTYSSQAMNELQNDTVTFGNKEEHKNKNIKKYLLLAGAVALTVAGGFLFKRIRKDNAIKKLLKENADAMRFIESAKAQKAEIVRDVIQKDEGVLFRSITKKLRSGTEVTNNYLGFDYAPNDYKPWKRIIKTAKAEHVVKPLNGDPAIVTRFSDGTFKLSGKYFKSSGMEGIFEKDGIYPFGKFANTFDVNKIN